MASSPDYDLSPDELNELLSAVMPEIPGYRVMRLLGRGGMSFVYLGVQESLDRPVAIKVIRPDALKDEISKLRFEKEARTIAKLQHPCIVGIHEVGRTDQGLLYYVMPYLSKGHLAQRAVTRDQPRIIGVLQSLLWALDYAHLRGMVHRDVKPENVLFDNADRPVLTDFGIALNRRERARITGTGFAMGSRDYMAPEQARGEAVDGRADLYSLGVLTYELLAGELPYIHDEPLGLALMHAMDPIPRLPAELQHWQPFIDKAMAKSRDHRFADAQEMMAALEQVEAEYTRASHGVAAAARPAPPQPGIGGARASMPRRWRAPALAAGFVVLAAAVLMAVGGRSDPRPPLPTAAPAADSAPATTTPADAAPVTAAATAPLPIDATSATATDAAALPDPGAAFPLAAPDASVIELVEADASAAVDAPELVEGPPGARELAAAQRQISQRRLTLPPGDNALQSLLDAQRLAPISPGLTAAGDLWLATATPYLQQALTSNRTNAARTLFANAKRLADALQLRQGSAWLALEQAVVAPFRERLAAALAARRTDEIDATKADARAMGIEAAALEPLWSQRIVLAQHGDRLSGSTAMLLVRLPDGNRPGLAAMPHAVTRDAYASFAKASGRAPSSCRIRTALMTLKRRSWQNPGFEQAGDHPAVCVSPADARAFAAWMSARDKLEYRLPSAAEWRTLADFPNVQQACADGRLRCQGKGTQAVGAGPAGNAGIAGIHAMHANVREWPADCATPCREYPTLGFSWRDNPVAMAAAKDSVDARHGYDDVGFRLVRAVTREELEAR